MGFVSELIETVLEEVRPALRQTIEDAVEPTARRIRASLRELVIGTVLLAAAGVLLALGLGLGAWGIYLALAYHLGQVGAAVVVALTCIALAGLLGWLGSRIAKG